METVVNFFSLDNVLNMLNYFVHFGEEVVRVFTTPIWTLLSDTTSWTPHIISIIIESIGDTITSIPGMSQVTLLNLMIYNIGFYLVYQFAIWLLNLIT